MKIMVLGGGSKAGAWKIRGIQLGDAIGATVLNGLSNANLVGYDLVVLVKRPLYEDVMRLQAAGIPIVWDVVDAWPQPIGNWWAKDACMRWFKTEVKRIKPKAIVATTKAMENDCIDFARPTITVPHHARPGLCRTPMREQIRLVGYEGGNNLGYWKAVLEMACKKRGWLFVQNPASLNAVDVVVAMREHDGYAVRHWKSAVKLANAQASGTPCVLNRAQGYLETQSGAELWADNADEVEAAFDTLMEMDGARGELADRLYAAAPHLEEIAPRYKDMVGGVVGMRCEMLTDVMMFRNGKEMLEAMLAAAPMKVLVRNVYVGDCELLMTYGMGHLIRRPWCQRHIELGKHCVVFDMGYWRNFKGDKLKGNRPMRMSIDADHPQAWITDQPPERFDNQGIRLRDNYNPEGPIILVGMGVKSNKMLNTAFNTWETAMLAKIKAVYPGKRIVYRPKNLDATLLPGTMKLAGMPIEQVLSGASLVVCRHSNVAVDACIAGVPVVCEDGAARALYGNDLAKPVRPTYEQRLRFLRNLAYFQWKPTEAAQCWQFLLNRIEEHDRVAA